jgi:hypothetical protein
MAREALESELMEDLVRKTRRSGDVQDAATKAFFDADFHGSQAARRNYLEQIEEGIRAQGLDAQMDPQELAALRSGADLAGTGSAAASLGIPAALAGGYAGNIYGAGQGAEYGTE